MQPTTDLRTQSVHERVLRTALHLFTERGYFNTSVPDIVRASAVSTGSIYHHFRDKAGIARTLSDSLIERMHLAFDAIEREHGSAHDRCRAVIELLFRMAEEEPAVMTFMLYSKHREFMPDQPPICSSKPFAQMREMACRGMENGEVRKMDPVVAAAAVFGGALRLIQLRLDGILERPLPELLDETWQCAWRSVAP